MRALLEAWAVARRVVLYRCAWCDEIVGGEPTDVAGMVGISDGLCLDCDAKIRRAS